VRRQKNSRQKVTNTHAGIKLYVFTLKMNKDKKLIPRTEKRPFPCNSGLNRCILLYSLIYSRLKIILDLKNYFIMS